MSEVSQLFVEAGPLIVFGAGGHGVVVAEAAERAGYNVIGFIDDNPDHTKAINRWPFLDIDAIKDAPVIVAIGRNDVRAAKWAELQQLGARFVAVVHPSAVVSRSAQIGRGVFVGPQSVVHSEAIIGDGAIINSAAVVEHHCVVGTFAHIAPNATLGGGATVGERSLIGIGASVNPKIGVGNDATVGAGSVVVAGVRDRELAIGVPAKMEREIFPNASD